jgi:norsolorinic acid ketoreductase
MTAAFDVNVLGPHRLFKATYELLGKAKKPVWATISSAAGSVSLLEGYGVSPLLAYGSSKAAVNWLTVSVFPRPFTLLQGSSFWA